MAIKEKLLIMLIIGMSAFATSFGQVYVRCPTMPQCMCNLYSAGPTHLECSQKKPPMTIQDYIKIFHENNVSEKRGITMILKELAPNSRIPSRIFEGFDIKTLEISFNENITMWADEEGGPAFVGLENTLEAFTSFRGIKVPRKYDNYQEEKAPMSLGHLRKLRRVELTYNDINTFANGWFDKGPSSLEELKINQCNTRYFGDRAFAGLSNLKDIRINHNPFESLSRSMFPNPANHLRQMDLEYNKVKYLSDDFFTNMPSLKYVYLASNRITHLPENIWRPIWSQLNFLGLSFNRVDCGDYISWTFNVTLPQKMWVFCEEPNKWNIFDLEEFIQKKQRRY